MNKKLTLIFKESLKTPWKDFTPDCEICQIADKYFLELPKDFTKQKQFERLVGQSASGKTTQLSISILKTYEAQNKKPYVFAIRNFAKYHPQYQQLFKKYKTQLIREKTNGFALKMALAVLQKLLKSGYLIVFEVTALDVCFEQYIFELLKKYNYKVNFHILAVNKILSDKLAKIREESLGEVLEAKRILYKKSGNYFWSKLKNGINFFADNFESSFCVVWNAFDKKPCFVGKIKDAHFAVKQNQKIIKCFCDGFVLQKSKQKFYQNNLHLL